MRYSDQVSYQASQIGKEFIKLSLDKRWIPQAFPNSPVWSRILKVFNKENYLYPCPPLELGNFKIETSSLKNLRVLRCPIKQGNSLEIFLPKELAPLKELVQFILETEIFVNPLFESFHAHLSFECTEVLPGTTQRVSGWHVDGFQGVRVNNHLIEHSYLWANVIGTEYCLQPFFINHLDPSRHNVFPEIESQAQENNVFKTNPNNLYLIDPYMVHRSPMIKEKTFRSFFRLTFTETELADPVNTINLAFPLPNYEPRIEVRDRLFEYKGDIPWDMYGIKK